MGTQFHGGGLAPLRPGCGWTRKPACRCARQANSLLSVNPSYHFENKDRTNRVVPFFTGGYGLAFRSGAANRINFGGGATFWFRDGLGFRFDVTNYRATLTTQFRFALTFR